MIGAGTTSYTVGSLMERLYVSYLTPPDAQLPMVPLAEDIDAAATSFTIGTFQIPEDEALLYQGALIEAGQDLMRVVGYSSAAASVTVEREAYGTVPSAHSTGDFLILNPPFTRASVFEAVADNIIQLFPRLYTVKAELLASADPGVFGIEDVLAVAPLSIKPDHSEVTYHGEIVDHHPKVGSRAVITNRALNDSCWVRYTRRMGKAEAETDTLESLGVDERWAQIIIVGAAADILVGRDIPKERTEFIQSVLEAENIRVGQRMSIAGGLRQYRNILLDEATKEMDGEYDYEVEMSNPFGVRT